MKLAWTLAIGLVLLPWATVAAESKSTLLVSVRNEFDKPVDNASVILDFLGSHQVTRLGFRKPVHWEVHTNQQGKAHFPPVPYGTVQVQVVTTKYQTFGQKVELDSDTKDLDVLLKRPQDQYSAHPPLKPAEPKQ